MEAKITKYQVQSKFPKDTKWQDDHLPFDSEEQAVEYIKTQPKCFEYKIVSYEEETIEESELNNTL